MIASLHLLGAPEPQAFTGSAPPELSAPFAARALGVSLVAWLALGPGATALVQLEAAGPAKSARDPDVA